MLYQHVLMFENIEISAILIYMIITSAEPALGMLTL